MLNLLIKMPTKTIQSMDERKVGPSWSVKNQLSLRTSNASNYHFTNELHLVKFKKNKNIVIYIYKWTMDELSLKSIVYRESFRSYHDKRK